MNSLLKKNNNKEKFGETLVQKKEFVFDQMLII